MLWAFFSYPCTEIRYSEYELQMEKGSKIFVYTDGVPEASYSRHTLFGTNRMPEALNGDSSASPRELIENVTAAIDRFAGSAEQFDDITMLSLEYRG